MKKSILLAPFFAVIAVLALSLVVAEDVAYPTSIQVEFNGVDLDNNNFFVGDVDDTIPIRVTFKSLESDSDVRVKVYIEGHRDDVSARTERFDVIANGVYTKLLNLKLPSDADELTEDYTLYVEIVSSTDRTEKAYDLKVQRESYTLEILSVDYDSKVAAGDVIGVSVVAKNNGFNRADDNYVIISIPELGVSARGYMGDLVAVENSLDDDEEDSVERIVFLKIPGDTKGGVYDLQVEVYNEDTRVSKKSLISIGDSMSLRVIATTNNREISSGETAIYNLVIVNSGDDIQVINLRASSSRDLNINLPGVVTVRPDSSETIDIRVTADDDADRGRHTFTVDVNGEVVTFTANVDKNGITSDSSTIVLVVILAIVFIVLLAILISLLVGRRNVTHNKAVEETSYY